MPLTAPATGRGAAFVALVVATTLSASCAGTADQGVVPSSASDPTTTTRPDERELGPGNIPILETEPLAVIGSAWGSFRTAGGRLFTLQTVDESTEELGRIDLETGELAARRTLPYAAAWQPTEAGVLVLEDGRRAITVLDLDTLQPVRRIELPDNWAGQLPWQADADPYWLGLRAYTDDSLVGRVTYMGAAQLDLRTGEVLRSTDLPACGAAAATQVSESRLALYLQCRNQYGEIDLRTGETTTYPSFPGEGRLFDTGDDLWVIWTRMGIVGRWRDGQLVTLDLNSPEATAASIVQPYLADGSLWFPLDLGRGSDAGLRRLTVRVDPERVEVVARTWATSHTTAVDGVGYAITGDRVVRFDPTSVVGGAPTNTSRPKPGVPPAAVAHDADERAVLATFSSVFDPGVPNEIAARSIEATDGILDVRNALVALASGFDGLELRVTSLSVLEDRASLAYLFLVNGEVAFVPFSATLRRDGGRWIVSSDSICQLADQAGVSSC